MDQSTTGQDKIETFDCAVCKQTINHTIKDGCGGTGYGTWTGTDGKVCYSCCANLERDNMVKTGRAMLYVATEPGPYGVAGRITDWPGKLEFRIKRSKIGRHNIGGKLYSYWFAGPSVNGSNSALWIAQRAGDNGNYVRCKRTKGKLVG